MGHPMLRRVSVLLSLALALSMPAVSSRASQALTAEKLLERMADASAAEIDWPRSGRCGRSSGSKPRE